MDPASILFSASNLPSRISQEHLSSMSSLVQEAVQTPSQEQSSTTSKIYLKSSAVESQNCIKPTQPVEETA